MGAWNTVCMACETPASPEPPVAQSNAESGRVDNLKSCQYGCTWMIKASQTCLLGT